MHAILDKLILITSCLALYLISINSYYLVVPIILSILLSCIFIYFEDSRLSFIGNMLYIAICFFVPNYIIFLPLLFYDIVLTKYRLTILLLPVLIAIHHQQYTLLIVIFSLINLLISIVLRYKSDKLTNTVFEYNELRDSSTSLSRLLEEKNKSLLKDQDYEINLAMLNERNRISKEIHDNIGHLLSRALLQVGALNTISTETSVKEGLSTLKEALSDGMDEIRSSIHKMYDESIDLYSQIENLVKSFNFCEISHEYDISSIPSLDIRHCLIYTAKEALANIMKHSNATRVNIILREHPAMYQLIIEDNGTINTTVKNKLLRNSSNEDYGEGMGLHNIVDRVKSFNGNVNIKLDNGFVLFISIPKQNGGLK